MSISKNSLETFINPLNSLIKSSPRKSLLPEKNIPKNIGPYEIKEKIIDSSYSKIYLGQSKYTGDKVAIKIIEKIYLLENMEDLLLIKRQIEILKLIKHRNILTLYEIFESNDFIFLIMEYIPGKNICEMIITKRRFREEEAQKIFVQIIDALYYLHKMNICHRNITSNHILLDVNNIPKLISFSYSSFYSKNQELKDSFGSLCHACPEIISEMPYKPELSDTWSLGIVLYTMVAGYLPFSEENDEKNKDLIVSGKIEYPKEMSNKLKDLLKHILDPNPKKRYDLNKIMKHPWFKPFNDKLIGGCNPLTMYVPIDDKILNIIEKFGFDKNKVKLDLKNNKYNNSTGLYKLLVKKANVLGFHTVSDLGCKEFLEYRDNKANYISDGDIKYEIYLKDVQKRIESIEKHIFEYQEKEENILKELNNLEDKLNQRNSINININNNNNSNTNNNTKSNNNSNSNNINNNSNKSNDKDISKTLENRKSLRGKSPEQNSKLLEEINNEINNDNINNKNNIRKNKEMKKIKSCYNFNKMANSLAFMNQSINYKKDTNLLNKPRPSHFSNNNESWQDTSINIKKRKSYLNSSTFFESLLKKTHPDNIRKSLMRKNIMSEINQVIIEEKEKENNNDDKKKKSLRFSLSFSEEENIEENSSEDDCNISKVDSRQLSMFDEDGIKFLKELKMIGSNYVYKGKKKSTGSNNQKENNNKKDISIISKNPCVTDFFDLVAENNKKKEKKENENINNSINKMNTVEKKESNDTYEKIYSTIKTDNNESSNKNNSRNINSNINSSSTNANNDKEEIKKEKEKEKINNNIMEIKEINEIIICARPKEKNNINNNIYNNNIELCSYFNDKKKLSKLNIDFNHNDLSYIETIHNKYVSKNIFAYNNDTKKIKKLENLDTNIKTSEEFIIPQINKEPNILPISNSNTINLNSLSNSKDEIIIKGNNNDINNINDYNKNGINSKIKKIYSASSSIKHNYNNNYKYKYPNSTHITQKHQIKDKIKLVKKSKINSKFKSDICRSKFTDELSLINMSDLSEIRPLSILSPSYLKSNLENKENIIMNNNINNINNIIENKSFQSKSQISSNLSMTHENNIFLSNINTNNINNINNNQNPLYSYRCNNNNTCYDYDLNNFYMVHLDNFNNFNKNTYSKNHLLNIKKRNLAQRLKEEIQKSIDKKQIKSSLLISSCSNSNSNRINNNNINNNNKKIFNKKVNSTKNISISTNNNIHNYKNNSNINGYVTNTIKNSSNMIRNKIPEYVNFIKIRENKLNNNINIKSNGKSVENIFNNNNNKSKNKLNQKKEKENYINNDKFIFCSSVRNFNNHYCFNKKHQRICENENCATKEKTGNKSISKRNWEEKNNKKELQIKSNGKKYDNALKEKNQREQGCNSHRSYLNIYEKDRLMKIQKEKEKEKIKNVKNIKQDEIITIYKNHGKKCENTYKRVLFKKID